ncbi:MAG: peptidase C13 family protein [Verrucomicrobia bacterium]|nr:peptidase C13 family protein [Deltaproteobacteria bacterium]
MKLTDTIKSRIMNDAINSIKKRKIFNRVNLHIHNDVLAVGEKLKAAALEVPIKRDSALVFVDLDPARNWVHPCEYHLYDATTGKLYQKVQASLPPSLLDLGPDASLAFHAPVKMVDTRLKRAAWKKRIPPITNAPSTAPGERYAILFAGHANNRHTNDLEFLYRTLIDVYGFNAAHIHVLNHDGTLNYFGGPKPIGNWPGDNTAYRMGVTGEGTRAGFQAAFTAIAGQIRPEDFLLIHTNNHGGGVGDGVTDFCMFVYDVNGNWVPYYVNDFIADLGVLPPFEVLMVMMEQCRSGGFINPIINNSPANWTHVAAAVVAADYSDGGADFDPFAEDWIAAMNGQYPDGTGLNQAVDTNNDGRVSAVEAFTYADAVVQGNDTPTSSDSPGGFGAFMFLGLPAHDLYLRDNLLDHGREPLVNGGISCSPDIIIFNQELLDPETELGTPAAQQSDTMGSPVEYGQDNFIYLRIQNRGTQPTNGTARVFWADPSVLPAPGSWTEITDPVNPIAIPAVNPQEMKIIGPVVWEKSDIPGKGHYCFVGLINSGTDPAPDPATIHTIDDYYNFIRQSNNATWKNFDVTDIFKNSLTNMSFAIQGWPRIKLSADLMIDLSLLPGDMQVTLRILKRLSTSAALENAKLVKDTATYQKFELVAGKQAFLRGMNLKTSDNCQATLEIIASPQIADGNYRLSVAELIDGKEMGRVTRMLAVGQFPYLGNRRTHEVHIANCDWAAKTSRRNKEAYQTLERALKRGYDGCRFCLPEFSKD